MRKLFKSEAEKQLQDALEEMQKRFAKEQPKGRFCGSK
jgi:hypothetical protein